MHKCQYRCKQTTAYLPVDIKLHFKYVTVYVAMYETTGYVNVLCKLVYRLFRKCVITFVILCIITYVITGYFSVITVTIIVITPFFKCNYGYVTLTVLYSIVL